ncbi:MAG TPA: Hsp70 family protein [Actinocatenispora sp.]
MAGVRLCVDFGTSNTVAVLARAGDPGETLLFDGSPLLPSAVHAQPDGRLITGRDALHSARLAPERFEPHPKQRVDDGVVLLGVEVPVVDLFTAVLGRVAIEAQRVAGGPAERVVLTHPAGWGPRRQAILREAAGRAGWDQVTLVPEAVAAARYFAEHHGERAGDPLVVYDLGAGTFDVSVVRGATVLAEGGLTDVGGLDVDTALIEHLELTYRPRDPAAWDRLRGRETAADRRAWQQLTDDTRAAKEMLSRTTQAFVYVPLLDVDAPVGREQLDAIAAPLIDRTVAATRTAIAAAALPGSPVLFLVGGASRMPLVAGMLHRGLGTAPTVAEQPELVVARGGLLGTAPAPAVAGTAPAVAGPAVADATMSRPVAPLPRPADPPRGRRVLLTAGLAALVLLAVIAAVKVVPLIGAGDATTPPPPKEITGTLHLCTSMVASDSRGCRYAPVVAADLDAGRVTDGKDDGSDIQIGGVNGGVAGLDAVNGAELTVLAGAGLPQGAADCTAAPGWALTIDPYRLTDGDVLCVRTSGNRLGYLSVTDHESKNGMVVNLTVTYKLWKPGA